MTTYEARRQDIQDVNHLKGLVHKLRNFVFKAQVPPMEQLETSSSSKFGRNIEQQLINLTKTDQILTLQLRKRNSAVVMSMEHYQSIQKAFDSLKHLADSEAARLLEDTADEYDALYNRLTSATSRQAADALFAATPEDLQNSYRPGGTEAIPSL